MGTGKPRLVGLAIMIQFFLTIQYGNQSEARTLAQKPTPQELVRLPEYCQIKLKYHGKPTHPPVVDRWESIIGQKGYTYLHHYCYGINWMTNRLNEPDLIQRDIDFALQSALGEFNFVLERWPKDVVLLPELLLNRATVLIKLERKKEAIESLIAAIRLKPDYALAYLALADCYGSAGEHQAAVEVLRLGLERNPESESLKWRLKQYTESQD